MRKFAVFDIDGTLIRWQLYHIIVDRLASEGKLSFNSKQQLRDARMAWKKREKTNSFELYERALISIFESSLQDLDPEDFDSLIDEVIDEYREQTYRYTRELISRLKEDNYFLIAISGSHHELVEEIAKFYKFDDWIGTKYERVSEKFSGDKFVASHHKKELLDKFVTKHNLSYESSFGIGDSGSDIPMLRAVNNPIAFNPSQELFEEAKRNGWKVVVERKNVIYELEQKKGNYSLI